MAEKLFSSQWDIYNRLLELRKSLIQQQATRRTQEVLKERYKAAMENWVLFEKNHQQLSTLVEKLPSNFLEAFENGKKAIIEIVRYIGEIFPNLVCETGNRLLVTSSDQTFHLQPDGPAKQHESQPKAPMTENDLNRDGDEEIKRNLSSSTEEFFNMRKQHGHNGNENEKNATFYGLPSIHDYSNNCKN